MIKIAKRGGDFVESRIRGAVLNVDKMRITLRVCFADELMKEADYT